MNRLLTTALLLVTSAAAFAQNASSGIFKSVHSAHDVSLATDPGSPFWRGALPVSAEVDAHGKPVPTLRTEVRSRWTKENLYLLYVCPYEELHLKLDPNTEVETNQLWNWDVAELFIGSNFQNIKLYKEFEVSPQGEWIDLDINLDHPHHEDGWTWNSGFQVAARIDRKANVWYAAMRIPFSAIDQRKPVAGIVFRANLFRTEREHSVAWQAPMSDTFHTPEHFGRLELVDKK